jgi:hypothetical protein
MDRTSGLLPGALFLILIAGLLSAGCTQPSGMTGSTAIPIPAIAAPSAPVTTAPGNQTLKTEMTGLAASFAREIDGKTFATAMKEGPNSTAFATVLGQLRAFQATDSRIAYVYTLEQQNGTVRFVIVANYGLPHSAEFMGAYPGAPAELKVPVTKPVGVGPYTDPWGTFVSGYAPLDTGSNETVILMAVDTRV